MVCGSYIKRRSQKVLHFQCHRQIGIRYEGSQTGNKSVLAITGTEINEGIELTQSPVGFVSKTTYCLPADHEACIETDLSEELTGMSALLATGSLKAVYKLQWGGELVIV